LTVGRPRGRYRDASGIIYLHNLIIYLLILIHNYLYY